MVLSGGGCAVERQFRDLRPQMPTAAERELAGLVNDSRAAWGLRPLRVDELLTAVARKHSEIMRGRGQGHHGDLGVRLREAGYPYDVACENVFVAPYPVRRIHEGFLQSQAHVDNLGRGDVGEMGIGIVDDGKQLYVTEIFARHTGYGRE